ncbi:cytosine permease [uncultured Microbacterium sp.]|uniref:cytosine permease n=1 Tax=uncultured Microbacterium sp. TaxID=191216 RepID=UPI0025EEFD34|nr:cytosine permease [uncultured Microbacterium sp.]
MYKRQVVVFGKALTDPVEIVKAINNPWVTVIGAVVFIIATIGINVVANFVSAAYDLAHLAPRWINFKRGGLISAVIAIFILPWHLYESPLAITYFLGGLGALLGPLYGVIFADYYLVRRAKVDVKALYSQNPQGPYFYRKGWNPLAIWSFAGAAVVTIPIALVPVFSSLATFAWPIGVVIAGGIYLLLNRGRRFDLPEYTASGQLAAELAAATEGEPA